MRCAAEAQAAAAVDHPQRAPRLRGRAGRRGLVPWRPGVRGPPRGCSSGRRPRCAAAWPSWARWLPRWRRCIPGLCHRDVKPANVLVAAGATGDHAYLTDFGLATPLGVTPRVRRRYPGYQAPEQRGGGPARGGGRTCSGWPSWRRPCSACAVRARCPGPWPR
ncbi:MAG: phosphotransferase [Thermoleophilia bacterium]